MRSRKTHVIETIKQISHQYGIDIDALRGEASRIDNGMGRVYYPLEFFSSQEIRLAADELEEQEKSL